MLLCCCVDINRESISLIYMDKNEKEKRFIKDNGRVQQTKQIRAQ